jgi:hypothetical protein
MAKAQKRKNREQKKREQDKPMSAAAQSALAALHGRRAPPDCHEEEAVRGGGDRPARPGGTLSEH